MVGLSRRSWHIFILPVLLGVVLITSCGPAERSELSPAPGAELTLQASPQPSLAPSRTPTEAPALTPAAEESATDDLVNPLAFDLPECVPGGDAQPQTYYTVTNQLWPDLMAWESYRYHAFYFYNSGDDYAENELALEITSARANRIGSIEDLDIQGYYQIPLIQQVYTGNHTQVRDLKHGTQSEYVITEQGAWLKPQDDQPWLALTTAAPADLITSHDIFGPHFLVGFVFYAEDSVMATTETVHDREVIHRCWALDPLEGDTVGYILHGIDLGTFFDGLEVHLWTAAEDTRLVRMALRGSHFGTRYFEEVEMLDPPHEFYYWIDVFDVNQPFEIEPPPESQISLSLPSEGVLPSTPIEVSSEAFPVPANSQLIDPDHPDDTDPYEAVRPREHYFETFELTDRVLTDHLGRSWYDFPAARQPVYDTDLSLGEVLAFYAEEMRARGWDLDRVVFQATGPRIFLVFTRDQVPALVIAERKEPGQTRLSLFEPPSEELIAVLLRGWEFYTVDNSDLLSSRVTAIDFDKAGNVWVSSQKTGGWTLTAY